MYVHVSLPFSVCARYVYTCISLFSLDCDKYGYSFSGYTNLCWKVYSDKKDADKANSICQADGGKLITLHTSEKLKYAEEFMQCSGKKRTCTLKS